MTIFEKISSRIITEQELIIGPIAWDEAQKVSGLKVVDKKKGEVVLERNSKESVQDLVSQYTRLFGLASTEACKQAVQDLLVELPKDQVPVNLQ